MNILILSLVIFMIGASMGSFYSVIVSRWQNRETILHPMRSYCDSCHHSLRIRELIPLVSYIKNKGRCHYCSKKIPQRYFYTELANGLLFLFLFLGLQFSWISHPLLTSNESFLLPFFLYSYTGFLFLGCLFDTRTLSIPKQLILALLIISILTTESLFSIVIWSDKLQGAFLGFLLMEMQYLMTDKKGLGEGDIFLGIATGFFLGWKYALIAIILGYSVASLYYGLQAIYQKINLRKLKIPLSPFILIGTLLSLVLGDTILLWYS